LLSQSLKQNKPHPLDYILYYKMNEKMKSTEKWAIDWLKFVADYLFIRNKPSFMNQLYRWEIKPRKNNIWFE
jgi:hypothetical protein